MTSRIRPVLKWPGGKYRMLDAILEILPQGKRLVEPFAGGGALFINSKFRSYLVNDINQDLITFYNAVKSGGDSFINSCKSYFSEENNNRDKFLLLRDLFNNHDPRPPELFLYLNRHGFNGLCRYNQKGGFNVPFGDYEKPYFPEVELKYLQKLSKKVKFTCNDFRVVFKSLRPGDVVYCDPPFLPLSPTSNFTSFSAGGFTIDDQVDLAHRAESSSVPVLISNHDVPMARDIFSKASIIKSVPCRRSIAASGNSRGKVNELLVLYLK